MNGYVILQLFAGGALLEITDGKFPGTPKGKKAMLDKVKELEAMPHNVGVTFFTMQHVPRK